MRLGRQRVIIAFAALTLAAKDNGCGQEEEGRGDQQEQAEAGKDPNDLQGQRATSTPRVNVATRRRPHHTIQLRQDTTYNRRPSAELLQYHMWPSRGLQREAAQYSRFKTLRGDFIST